MNAPPALEPGQPVGEALRSVAAEILTRAQTILDDPAREPTVTVHDIRRAMKRWRAMLRMLNPILGDGTEALREQARDLSRKLTVARDAQSAIDAFQDAVEAAPSQPAGASRRGRSQTIQSRLEALRAEGERSIWNDERRSEMSEYLGNAAGQVADWNFRSVDLRRCRRHVGDNLRRARRAIPQILGRYRGRRTARTAKARGRTSLPDGTDRAGLAAAWPHLGRRSAKACARGSGNIRISRC